MSGHVLLYESAADDPTKTEGLGELDKIENITVSRARQAFPTLSCTIARDSKQALDIKRGMIIVTTMGEKDSEKNQKFRIAELQKTQDDIEITATHIFGDTAFLPIGSDISIANASPSVAFDAVKNAIPAEACLPITLSSDISKVANLNWQMKDGTAVSNILLGADEAGDTATNTFEGLYGGEFTFDNYHAAFNQRGGEDTGFVIKWGQNLLTINQDSNSDNNYNAILPYATYSPTTEEANPDGTEDFVGKGIVQYVGTGGLDTWSSPFKGGTKTGTVQNGQYYTVTKQATDNTVDGATWYEIGDNRWVSGVFFKFDKSGAYAINEVKGQGTISIPEAGQNGTIVPYRGVGTIQYAGKGKVALWTSPFSDQHTNGKYVANGSNWKIWRKAVNDQGHVWYDLGASQWVDSQYFSVQKNYDYVTTSTGGILEVTGTVTAMSGPGRGSTLKWSARKGSRWRVTNSAVDGNGETWYQISTYIWVKSGDGLNFKSDGTVDTTDPEKAANMMAQTKGQVPVYSEPTYRSKATGEVLKAGTQWKVLGQADNNGTTWYELGENQWVDANYLTFDNDSDVNPGDGSDTDDNLDGNEITVKLSDTNEGQIVKSPFMKPGDPLRVLPVDLSSYNVRDTDKLRTVADAYIKEYRIGYPNVSVTLSFEQLQGKYKYLSQVDLYDLVTVIFDPYDIAQKAEVNSVTWDPLLERYTEITIGDLPITYEHLLSNYMTKSVEKKTVQLERKSTHLFGEMHRAMELQGQQQKSALVKLADEMHISYKTNTDAIDKLQNMVQEINTTVDDVQSWISGGGSGVIRAIPNWQSPTMLVAETGNGGQMQFSGNGLQFVGSDGIDQTAIDSRGNVVAEAITAGTIKGVTLRGVTVDGDSYLRSVDSNGTAVMSGTEGFSYSPSGIHSMALGSSGNQPVLRLGYASLTENGLNDLLYWARTNIKGFRG